jgi:hypothetical protein
MCRSILALLLILFLPGLAGAADTNMEIRLRDAARADVKLLQPPVTPLTAYARVELMPAEFSQEVQADGRKAKKASLLASRLADEAGKPVAEWNGRAMPGEGKLIVKPTIERFRIVSGGARFWAGAWAGESGITVTLSIVDAATGSVVASPVISKTANSMAGAWSFGSTDNNLINYITATAREYLIVHLIEAAPQAAPGS